MKTEIMKAGTVLVSLVMMLAILVLANSCATQQAQAPPMVIVVCDQNAEAVRAQIEAIFSEEDQPFYEDFIDWFQRYGGAAVLGIFPFLIW